MSLVLIASIVHHVVSLDAAGIAVTVVILAYYSTSRASKSFPGSYDPGMSSMLNLPTLVGVEKDNKACPFCTKICNCHRQANSYNKQTIYSIDSISSIFRRWRQNPQRLRRLLRGLRDPRR